MTLEKAVEASPDSAVFQLNLGITYELMGEEKLAAEAYQKAIELKPLWQEAYFWRETPFRIAFHGELPTVEASPVTLVAAEENLAKLPDRVASYLDVIPFYLEAGMLNEAQEAIHYAQLAYTVKAEESLLLRWYEAELAARNEDYLLAARTGDDIIHQFMQQGIYGYGSFGTLMYDQLVFRRPAMVMEFVPQMTLIVLPDVWGKRLQQTAEWYAESGDLARADELMEELKRLIPDFENR
jgi:tetratricopeptide (TPR) repeat protein